MLDGFFDALREFADSLGVFSILALSALDTVGLPASGDIAVVTAAALRTHPFAVIALMGFAGAVIGDQAAYWAGRIGGRPLLRRFVGEERQAALSERIERRAALVLILGHMVAGVRTETAVLAGAAPVHYRRFTTWNTLACAIWAVSFTLLGRILGATVDFETWLSRISDYTTYLAIAAVVLTLGWFWHSRRRGRSRSGEPDVERDTVH
jgi:membrane-associated protein